MIDELRDAANLILDTDPEDGPALAKKLARAWLGLPEAEAIIRSAERERCAMACDENGATEIGKLIRRMS